MRKKYIKFIYWRKFTVLLFILVNCIACTSQQEIKKEEKIVIDDEVKQHEYDRNEVLVVFYDLNQNRWINDFAYAYPNVKIESYLMDGGGIEQAIERYGYPDIILCNTAASWANLETWREEGLIEDLSNFIWEDSTINMRDYVGGTFEVLQVEDEIIGVPLSWDMRCMVIRNTYWDDFNEMSLMKRYTGERWIKVLNEELERAKENDHSFWTNDGFELEGLIYSLDVIKEEKDEIYIDEETFESLYKFSMTRDAIESTVEKSYNDNSFYSEWQAENYSDSMKHMGSTFWGAPQITAVHAKSVVESKGYSAQFYWIPTWESEDEYMGRVQEVALLGGMSSRKQEAYEVIRLMMDMPRNPENQAGGNGYSPVNIDCALQMLEDFEKQSSDILIYRDQNIVGSVERQKLSRDEKEQVQKVILGIKDLYLYDYYLYDVIGSYSEYYSQRQIMEYKEGDYRQCYYEVMKKLNPYSKSWNLTSFEVEQFINEVE